MIVLGIDPGIERLGWAILKKNENHIEKIDSGVKKTSTKISKSKRLFEIFIFLDNIIKKSHPHTISIEKLFFAKNVKTALVIGEVRGIILSVAEMHSLKIKEYAPLEVKTAVCGYGKANKEAVASMVKILLKMPKNKLLDDETDAIAIALTALVSHE